VLALRDKESVSYTFATTRHLDTFWGHTQSILANQTPVSEPVFSYDPHYWFYIAREETEKKLVQDIAASGRQFLMTVGSDTPLDRILKSDFNSDNLQYHLAQIFEERNYYVVVVGDFITEVKLDEKVAAMIDDAYSQSETMNEEVIKKLQAMLAVKARHKIKISRNSRKAKLLKAKLAKNFYVRK